MWIKNEETRQGLQTLYTENDVLNERDGRSMGKHNFNKKKITSSGGSRHILGTATETKKCLV